MARPALLLLTLTAALAALSACAGRRGPPKMGMVERTMRNTAPRDILLFTGFDSNGDTRVDQAELEAGVKRSFTLADTDKSGVITPLEFEHFGDTALGGGEGPPFRLDFDRNVDGAITPEEFRAELLARAKTYDSDKDGILTRAELAARAAAKANPGAPMDGKKPGGGEARGPGGPPPQ